MTFCKAVVAAFVLLFVGVFSAIWNDILPPKASIPHIEDKWFGPGQKILMESIEIKPFKVEYNEDQVKDLKLRIKSDLQRLKEVDVHPLEDSADNFEYGFNIDYLINTVAPYWLNKYDWKKQSKMLNKIMPSFVTSIDGIDVHFSHIKPKTSKKNNPKKVLPILMVHGWPGSYVEFTKIVPMLTTDTSNNNEDFIFEVIAPSIPGYGFSSSPAKKGFDAIYTSKMLVKLMERLGHKTFYYQGGDWGAFIGNTLTTLYPDNVRGLHLNMFAVGTPSAHLKLIVSSLVPKLVLEKKDYWKVIPLMDKLGYMLQETGYFHIQATKPDTVGLGLTTSPLALASYILEKFSTWTSKAGRQDEDGSLLKQFTMDDLLNNVMIYWINGNIISSQRYYKENLGGQSSVKLLDGIPIENVPVGLAAFPEELRVHPKNFVTGKYRNLVSYTDMPVGGHFAAYEQPKLLFNDIVQFVALVESDDLNSKEEL